MAASGQVEQIEAKPRNNLLNMVKQTFRPQAAGNFSHWKLTRPRHKTIIMKTLSKKQQKIRNVKPKN